MKLEQLLNSKLNLFNIPMSILCSIIIRLPLHEFQIIGGKLIDFYNKNPLPKFPVGAPIASNRDNGSTYPYPAYIVKEYSPSTQSYTLSPMVVTDTTEKYDKFWVEKHFYFF